MLLSIVIPVYNVEKYVGKCIQSCIDQNISYDDYEIIIVNDGTQDKSMDVIDVYHKKYPNLIKIHTQKNKGLSAARNAGLKLAIGNYIWFIDSDDWITSNCLKAIKTKIFSESPEILAICYSNLINNNLIRKNEYKDEIPKRGKTVFNKMIMPCAPFAIYKRKFLIENNLYFHEGIFHEDAEFMPKVYYKANKVSFTNDTLYNVYPNPNSITRTINPKKAFDYIVICNSLNKFANEITKDCIIHLNFLISMNLNNALALSYKMNKKEIEKLNKTIYENNYIFIHLKYSNVFKYIIEYYLFKLFPKKYVQIYKILQLFNLKNY